MEKDINIIYNEHSNSEELSITVQVYLWTQTKAKLITVNENVTISHIIKFLNGNESDLVVFTATETPIINFNKTLVDYNMWFPKDKNYIAELCFFKKEDIYLYNKKRLDEYTKLYN